LFEPKEMGWHRKIMGGKAGEPGALPKIVKNGTNNGFFVHSRSLWWQTEDTAGLPDHVDRRSFTDLLKNVEPRLKPPQAALKRANNSLASMPGGVIESVGLLEAV
jgi:hypothetical protein